MYCKPGHRCAASTESEGAPEVLIIHIDQELIEACRPWMGDSEGDETVLVSVRGPRRSADMTYLVGSVAKERGGI